MIPEKGYRLLFIALTGIHAGGARNKISFNIIHKRLYVIIVVLFNNNYRRNLSAPGAVTGAWDHCMTYDTNWTEVLNTLSPPPSETPLIPCQHGWEFEFKDIPYETVTTEVTLSLTYI